AAALTLERIDARAIRTGCGAFRWLTSRDRIAHDLHFALVRGTPDATVPALVRVQVENPLSDLLHWRRDDFGVSGTDALRAIAAEGQGAMVVLSAPRDADALLARLRAEPADGRLGAGAQGKDVGHWRRNGAGAQILHDLGYRQLRVLGTPRRQVALGGFGLDVVEHVDVADAGRPDPIR